MIIIIVTSAKHQCSEAVIDTLKMIAVHTKTSLRCIHTDNGTDVGIGKPRRHGEITGAVIHASPPYEPANNGRIERTVQQVISKTRW